MHTASEYRQYAQECMDSARIATADAVRMQFLELAQLWLAAAARLEQRTNGKTVWPTKGTANLLSNPRDRQ
jgi:hypothetical protein